MNRLLRQFLLLFFVCSFTKIYAKNTSKILAPHKGDQQPLFSYSTPIPRWALENKHHVLHVTPKEKSSHYLKLKKQRYNLLNLHFHYPSEHTVHGKFFPLEAHFVHENAKRELAIVSVLIQEGKKHNPWYARLVSCLKKIVPFKTAKTNVHHNLHLEQLLPPGIKLAYLNKNKTATNQGGITWLIAKQPVTLNKEQINTIKACYQNRPHQTDSKKHAP